MKRKRRPGPVAGGGLVLVLLIILLYGLVPSPAPTLESRVITIDGLARSYHLYVPNDLPADEPAPLVLAFHGRGKDGNGPAFAERTGLHHKAREEGFIVVFPDGVNHRWLDGGTLGDPHWPDDVKFVEAIIEEVEGIHSVDPARVYCTGFSNGSAFCQILAIRSNRFAAIGCVGAGLAYPFLEELAAAEPVSVIMSCGSRDPYCGARELVFDFLMSLEETCEAWLEHNSCHSEGRETEMEDLDPGDGCRVTRTEWTGCRNGTSVVLLWAEGGGHDWYRGPGSATRCRDIDDTALIWEFFEAQTSEVCETSEVLSQ